MRALTMATVFTTSDLRSFKRCRRAWDLGSPSRQNLAPNGPLRPFEVDTAIRDALAVYYYPGMWSWPRKIVEPIAFGKYAESMSRQLEGHDQRFGTSDEDRELFERMRPLGETMLRRYFEWAPSVDWFHSVRVDTDFRVNPPDPDHPGDGLVAGGHAVRYAGRIDLLAVEQAVWRRQQDDDTVYWIVHHRVAGEEWAALGDLLLDDRGTSSSWAGQDAARVRVVGVVYNELRAGVDLPARVLSDSTILEAKESPVDPVFEAELVERLADERIRRQTSQWCRRTWVAMSPSEIDAHQQRDSEAIEAMLSPTLPLYASPSAANCAHCAFRTPCMAMNRGEDPVPILEQSYRGRQEELAELKGWPNQEPRHSEGHLGRWSAW
jgi:hypothetical protein